MGPRGRDTRTYSKTCVQTATFKKYQKKYQKLVFKTDYGLMEVKSIAECCKGSILQYFRPSLSYYLSLRSLFCLFLSSRLRQVDRFYCTYYIHKNKTSKATSSLFLSEMIAKLEKTWRRTRDFPAFLKSGPGACWIWENHLDHQNWENLMQSKTTRPPF